MKYFIIIFFLITYSAVFSQQEFQKSKDDLIYSDTTITQLKYIVDSLNLKFKSCDLSKTYFSKKQGKAHYVMFKNEQCKDAIKDMDNGISFENFEKKYANAEFDKELLIVVSKYKDYEENEITEFSSPHLGNKHNHEIKIIGKQRKFMEVSKGNWIYKYYPKSNYSDEYISAYYITEDIKANILFDKYAKMIQYSDCMVDTSTQVFFKTANSGFFMSDDKLNKVSGFMAYIAKATNKPTYNDKDYYEKYTKWEKNSLNIIDSLKINDKKFEKIFTEAILEAIKNGNSNDEFESYVSRYDSPATALKLKRNRIVVGGCSQDNSPRYHALNIAKLSAETVNWEVFLRSHLDIMNDKFQRVSDGSYAQAERQTYIKELEILDINVLDLLLGISLRIDNPSTNHYYGNIGRLGRAMAETRDRDELEKNILSMISDNQLDDYNRIVMYYLFVNYNYHLIDKQQKENSAKKLQEATKNLPQYLAIKLENNE